MLNRERTRFEAASSARAFADVSRHARTVVQAEALDAGTGDRDAFMAENALWLLDQAGPGARIALWAHNGHVQRTPDNFNSMGAVLDRALGTEMLVVGFAFGQGTCTAVSTATGLTTHTVPAPIPDSYEAGFAGTARPRFLLDMRGLSPGTPGPDWILGAHSHRSTRLPVRRFARGPVLLARAAGPAVRGRGLFRRHERVACLSVPTASSAEASAMRRWTSAPSAATATSAGSTPRSSSRSWAAWSPTSPCPTRCTSSPTRRFAVGLLGVAELVPLLATAFVGGALADGSTAGAWCSRPTSASPPAAALLTVNAAPAAAARVAAATWSPALHVGAQRPAAPVARGA